MSESRRISMPVFTRRESNTSWYDTEENARGAALLLASLFGDDYAWRDPSRDADGLYAMTLGELGSVDVTVWNATIPVGTPVRYWPVVNGVEVIDTKTRGEAWELGSGVAVVKVEGIAGGVALSHLSTVYLAGGAPDA